MDALPAHLVTPFNGPIPPSNLLDKIARGVSQAKGPADWPHSIRATRVKLLELARAHAKEEALAEQRRQIIREEVEIDDGSNYSYFHDGEEKPVGGPRRPLYRQSSMDFIKPTPADIKDNASIARSVLLSQDLVLPFIPSLAFRIVSSALIAFSPTRAITHTLEPPEPTADLHRLLIQRMFRPSLTPLPPARLPSIAFLPYPLLPVFCIVPPPLSPQAPCSAAAVVVCPSTRASNVLGALTHYTLGPRRHRPRTTYPPRVSSAPHLTAPWRKRRGKNVAHRKRNASTLDNSRARTLLPTKKKRPERDALKR